MRITLTWILFMILPYTLVNIQSAQSQIIHRTSYKNGDQKIDDAQYTPKHADDSESDEQIISVRITSSVAVGRGSGKVKQETSPPVNINIYTTNEPITTETTDIAGSYPAATNYDFLTSTYQTSEPITDLPPHLAGANIEYIKQLQARKETHAPSHSERVFQTRPSDIHSNETVDSVAEPSIQNTSVIEEKDGEPIEDVPLARSIPLSYSSKSYLHRQGQNNQKLTTVSFNVVHDTPKLLSYNDHSSTYVNPSQPVGGPPKYYNEPAKVYSQPAQVYSEPAKFYSEPAKIYSEPAKVYSEPAKIYSEPSKIYSEPAKFYSEPASLHLRPEEIPTTRNPWLQRTDTTAYSSTYSTTPPNIATNPSYNKQRLTEHQPEKNYEVDEKVSVMTDGRSHGVQPNNNPENCKQENCKVGYVVEGRQYRKYRVEERTSDGFIVGEYGVVRNEDGALRGVRYTADSEASPRLIHDALMKFLQLK
ncbi:unnamed protein product [Colias eurytheme]|nr:unnamed protein product [Colias eurytheme]